MTDGALKITGCVEPRRFELPNGIRVNGAFVREIEVGPRTSDVELAALVALPDDVDVGLLSRFYQEAAQRVKKEPIKQPLTKAQQRRAAVIAEIVYRHECKYRVSYFGGLPPDRIVEAVGLLTGDDAQALFAAAKEIDDDVDRFRRKDSTAAATPGAAGDAESAPADDVGDGARFGPA